LAFKKKGFHREGKKKKEWFLMISEFSAPRYRECLRCYEKEIRKNARKNRKKMPFPQKEKRKQTPLKNP